MGENNKNRKAQNISFDKQTITWEKMIIENPSVEIIITGDFNIDANAWKKEEKNKSPYEKSFNSMSKMIRNRLIDNGLNIINNKNTRENSRLDHFYTNSIEKISEMKQEDNTSSDHSMLIALRKMKVNKSEEIVIETRDF